MKFIWFQVIAALAVSVIAAWFSIVGLVAVFPGAATAIIAMGIALEAAKLVTANTLFRQWNKLNKLFKAYFVAATILLSGITSLGIFGYLSKAHIQHSVAVGSTVDAVSLVDNQIAIIQQNIASNQQVLRQMDDAVTKLLNDTATVRRAIYLRSSQRSERKKLTDELTVLNNQLLTLQTQKLEKNQTRREVEVDVGPLKYVADMLYGNDSSENTDRAARLLITALIFVFDPLALLLLVQANQERKKEVRVDTVVKLEPIPQPKRPIVIPTLFTQPPQTPSEPVQPGPVDTEAERIGHHRLDELASEPLDKR